MSKFSVGDRVSVVGWTFHGNQCFGSKAKVIGFGENHGVTKIRFDENDVEDYVHVRQCRRLVKRERRRVWVGYDREGEPTGCRFTPDIEMPYFELVEFVEVKMKRGKA